MKYTILGGGITGLSAAHYLSKFVSTEKIVVLEASNRLGGWINTSRHGDGILHEHGPRTIRPAGLAGANTLELAEELGLSDKIIPIVSGHPATKNRLVLVDSELHTLPSSLKSLIFKQKPFGSPLFMAGVKDFLTRSKKCDDDSIYDFVKRRFGQDLADFAIDPMVRGICAGNAKEISTDGFVTTELFRYEQQYGGILKGAILESIKNKISKTKKVDNSTPSKLVSRARAEKWNVWTLKNGLETLVESMEQNLIDRGVEIHKNVKINKISMSSSNPKNLNVITNDGTVSHHQQDHIFSSLPAFATSELLQDLQPLTTTRTMLASIPYVTVAVINIEYDGNVLNRDPAFGFLVPSSQKEPLLGVIFDTCSFPQENKTIFTAMLGGAWFQSLFGENPSIESIEKIAVEQVSKILKLGELSPSRISGRIHRNCIAQYTIGHRSRVGQARKCLEESGLPLSIIGSSYDGVGVNDAIMSAKLNVERVVASKRL